MVLWLNGHAGAGQAPTQPAAAQGRGTQIERKTAVTPDGVSIVYSAAGTGSTALVFIHGGLADRTFYERQLEALSDRYRVIALDLSGHGESGKNRAALGISQFGTDAASVVQAEKLARVVLLGNSLGGPVAIDAALRLPDRVIGVVGIDTFQDIGHPDTAEYAGMWKQEFKRRAETFGKDYAGGTRAMVKQLFQADADPAIVAEAERRMLRTSSETAVKMFDGLADYDPNVAARKLTVPLRAINGDLYPTDVEKIRKVKPDFDAVIMKHMGHYPMMERPEEFNALVRKVVEELEKRQPGAKAGA